MYISTVSGAVVSEDGVSIDVETCVFNGFNGIGREEVEATNECGCSLVRFFVAGGLGGAKGNGKQKGVCYLFKFVHIELSNVRAKIQISSELSKKS